ncbi:MAG: ABC transporter permease [Clostridia bacterium]
MNNVMNICRNFIRIILKKKNKIFVYVILPPLLAVALMFMMSGGQAQPISIAVSDQDQTVVSRHLTDYLGRSGQYRVWPVDPGDVQTAISSRSARGAIVIPEGFEDSLFDQAVTLSIELVSIEGVAVTGWLEGFLNQKVSVIQKAAMVAGNRQEFHGLLQEYEDKYLMFKVSEVMDVSNKMESTQSGFGIFIFASIIAIWGVCILTFLDRKNRTYQRMMSAPVSHMAYISGNMAACLFFAVLHMAISLGLLYSFFDIAQVIAPVQMASLMMSLYLSVIPLGLLLVSFSRGQGGIAAVNILILTFTSMLGGCYWPVEIMPEFMQKLARITPQFWFMDGIARVMRSGRLADAALNMTLLVSSGVVFVLLYVLRSKMRKSILE